MFLKLYVCRLHFVKFVSEVCNFKFLLLYERADLRKPTFILVEHHQSLVQRHLGRSMVLLRHLEVVFLRINLGDLVLNNLFESFDPHACQLLQLVVSVSGCLEVGAYLVLQFRVGCLSSL